MQGEHSKDYERLVLCNKEGETQAIGDSVYQQPLTKMYKKQNMNKQKKEADPHVLEDIEIVPAREVK